MTDSLRSADDRDLLTRHTAGDREAFGVLVERHRDRLWRVALRTLGNPDDAADAVQDALLSAYRAASSFRGDAAVTTWLHRIVVNACLDLGRRRSARPTVALAEDADDTVPDAAAGDAFEQRDTADEVLAALRQIGPEQAAAIVLVDIEGYPVADAAEILEIPIGTVKSRCARGRASLASLLADRAPRNPSSGNPLPPDGVQRDGMQSSEEHE